VCIVIRVISVRS